MFDCDVAIIVPKKGCGGVEIYSKFLEMNIGQKEAPKLLYLSDHKIKDNSFLSLAATNRHVNLIESYKTVITHGQFGYVSLFHRNVHLIVHGNPTEYFFSANHWSRFLKILSWILLFSDIFLLHVGIIFSKKVYYVADHVEKSLIINRFIDKNKIVHNCTIQLKFHNNDINRYEKTNELIAVISNASHEKGLDRINKLVNQIKRKCIIIGTDNSELKKTNNLIFRGRLSNEDAQLEIRKSKVLIHLSRYEGLPLVILEALSLGVPCVISNDGWSDSFKGLESILTISISESIDAGIIKNKINNLETLSVDKIQRDFNKLMSRFNSIVEKVND